MKTDIYVDLNYFWWHFSTEAEFEYVHKIVDKVAERQLEISEKSNEKIIKRIETFWLYFL